MIEPRRLTWHGLRLVIDGNWRIPTAGFDLSDEVTAEAIRSGKPEVIETLRFCVDHAGFITDLPRTYQNLEVGWEYNKNGGPEFFQDYQNDLARVQDNPFADEQLRSRAARELEDIQHHRKREKPKETERETKERLSKNRRSRFQRKRTDLFLALVDRDGYQCHACESQYNLTVDHILPLSKGGTDALDNLQLLCKSCNSSKRDGRESNGK